MHKYAPAFLMCALWSHCESPCESQCDTHPSIISRTSSDASVFLCKHTEWHTQTQSDPLTVESVTKVTHSHDMTRLTVHTECNWKKKLFSAIGQSNLIYFRKGCFDDTHTVEWHVFLPSQCLGGPGAYQWTAWNCENRWVSKAAGPSILFLI